MAATTIIGFAFNTLATTRELALTTAMDAIIAAEGTYVLPALKAVAIIYIAKYFYLTATGHFTIRRTFNWSVRILVVVFLVAHTQNFIQHVRDPIFNNLPVAIANIVAGSVPAGTSGVGQGASTPAQMFDQASLAGYSMTAALEQRNSGYWPSAIVTGATIEANNYWFQTLLGVMFFVWLVGRTSLAIILMMGIPVLCFELFERTRGFVDQWIGKLVAMTVFGLAVDILAAIELADLMTAVTTTSGALPANLNQAVAAFGRVAQSALVDAFMILVLPAVCAIGSGVAASHSAPSAAAFGAARWATGRVAAIGSQGLGWRGLGNRLTPGD